MDQRDVLAHGHLPQFQPGLALYAPERARRNVAIGMRNGDTARFRAMLELNVAALLGDAVPSIRFERADDGPAVHGV
jgi:hypothetical protein